MKILHVVPGSGDTFYCQNCLRDGALVRALRQLGHDAVVAPLYLPLGLDDPGVTQKAPVFYGAVSLYLKQTVPLLRRLPGPVERWLDSPRVLRWAAARAGATRARGLEEMTLSMLRGEAGNQARELDRLTAWLAGDARPEVVHLSNALLLGLARQIKQRVGVPVVCSLQDEDTWVDAMPPQAAQRVWALMAERAADVDAFAAVSRAYADKMVERMALPPGRVRVVPLGIDLEGYAPCPLPHDPPVIGYLSRLTESLGLGLLVDAFIRLKQRPGLAALRLRATGGATADDRSLLRRIDRTLRRAGMRADVEILPEFGRAERLAFLRTLSVLSVPARGGEAFGTYQIEAMACGVPVVQPRAGAFPEVVQATGGGVLYDPAQPDGLDDALAALLLDPERTRTLGAQGRAAVQAKFTIQRMAENMVSLYKEWATDEGSRR